MTKLPASSSQGICRPDKDQDDHFEQGPNPGAEPQRVACSTEPAHPDWAGACTLGCACSPACFPDPGSHLDTEHASRDALLPEVLSASAGLGPAHDLLGPKSGFRQRRHVPEPLHTPIEADASSHAMTGGLMQSLLKEQPRKRGATTTRREPGGSPIPAIPPDFSDAHNDAATGMEGVVNCQAQAMPHADPVSHQCSLPHLCRFPEPDSHALQNSEPFSQSATAFLDTLEALHTERCQSCSPMLPTMPEEHRQLEPQTPCSIGHVSEFGHSAALLLAQMNHGLPASLSAQAPSAPNSLWYASTPRTPPVACSSQCSFALSPATADGEAAPQMRPHNHGLLHASPAIQDPPARMEVNGESLQPAAWGHAIRGPSAASQPTDHMDACPYDLLQAGGLNFMGLSQLTAELQDSAQIGQGPWSTPQAPTRIARHPRTKLQASVDMELSGQSKLLCEGALTASLWDLRSHQHRADAAPVHGSANAALLDCLECLDPSDPSPVHYKPDDHSCDPMAGADGVGHLPALIHAGCFDDDHADCAPQQLPWFAEPFTNAAPDLPAHLPGVMQQAPCPPVPRSPSNPPVHHELASDLALPADLPGVTKQAPCPRIPCSPFQQPALQVMGLQASRHPPSVQLASDRLPDTSQVLKHHPHAQQSPVDLQLAQQACAVHKDCAHSGHHMSGHDGHNGQQSPATFSGSASPDPGCAGTMCSPGTKGVPGIISRHFKSRAPMTHPAGAAQPASPPIQTPDKTPHACFVPVHLSNPTSFGCSPLPSPQQYPARDTGLIRAGSLTASPVDGHAERFAATYEQGRLDADGDYGDLPISAYVRGPTITSGITRPFPRRSDASTVGPLPIPFNPCQDEVPARLSAGRTAQGSPPRQPGDRGGPFSRWSGESAMVPGLHPNEVLSRLHGDAPIRGISLRQPRSENECSIRNDGMPGSIFDDGCYATTADGMAMAFSMPNPRNGTGAVVLKRSRSEASADGGTVAEDQASLHIPRGQKRRLRELKSGRHQGSESGQLLAIATLSSRDIRMMVRNSPTGCTHEGLVAQGQGKNAVRWIIESARKKSRPSGANFPERLACSALKAFMAPGQARFSHTSAYRTPCCHMAGAASLCKGGLISFLPWPCLVSSKARWRCRILAVHRGKIQLLCASSSNAKMPS